MHTIRKQLCSPRLHHLGGLNKTIGNCKKLSEKYGLLRGNMEYVHGPSYPHWTEELPTIWFEEKSEKMQRENLMGNAQFEQMTYSHYPRVNSFPE